MTRSSRRPWRPRPRASVASFAAAHRRMSGTNSAAPSGVSNKTRKCQKDSTKHGGDAGGLQMHRPQALLGEGGAEAREVGASGFSQQQDAHDRRGDKKGSRPQPADQARHHDERKQLRRRKRDQPNKRPFNQRHRPNSCVRSRYQPCWRHGWDRLWSGRCDDLCRLFGASLWISAVACLHIGMGTDLCLRRFPSAGSH